MKVDERGWRWMNMTDYLVEVLKIEGRAVQANAEPSFTYVFEKEEQHG